MEGVKGPGGGYRLARDATTISAGDVVRAVEGPVAVVACVLAGSDGEPACNRVDRCATHLLWQRLSEAVAEVLDSVTLKDLADQAQPLVLGET